VRSLAVVVLGADAHRIAKLADAFAERARELRQAPGPEHDQRHHRDEQQVDGVLDAHAPFRLALTRTHVPPGRRIRFLLVPGEPQAQRGYPPPPDPEQSWPALLTVLASIGLQLTLPARLTAGPTWLVPSLEGLLLIGLFFASPRELEHEHTGRRRAAIALIAIVSAANVYSLGALVHYLLHHKPSNGRELVISGVLIWLTNFLIFGLWYWQLDRGGPGRRAAGHDGPPDFLFPQMSDDSIEPRNWRPRFLDYMYVSLTNATAFSPTDAMPLSQMAKVIMGVQSLVSLVTLGLIVSRAVNIL
jgi:uncharacterized membrane protein